MATVSEVVLPETTRVERIRSLVQTELAPMLLTIEDESHRHAHHAGMTAESRGPQAGALETHLNVTIVSNAFEGQSRIVRSRRINTLLASEFKDGLHALRLVLKTPEEMDRT
ncbi:MAG: BolA family transcriptional regulator [Acetobacter sp.]|nr:BolA family transcriptional regulator [Acetobacter sp.]